MAGQTLSLTCTVTEQHRLTFPPLVQFLDAFGDPLNQQNIVSSIVGSVTTLVLTFSPLVTSAGGQYGCRATVLVPQESAQVVTVEATINVTVTSKLLLFPLFIILTHVLLLLTVPQPNVLVVSQNESLAPYAGIEFSLVCQIGLDTVYVDVAAEADVVWIDSEGQTVTNDTRITVLDTQTGADDGYESILTFSPLSLTDSRDYTCSATIVPDNPSPFVIASNSATDTYTINVTGMPEHTLAGNMSTCYIMELLFSSTRSNPDIFPRWFWNCRRASVPSVHLPIHTRPLSATLTSNPQ